MNNLVNSNAPYFCSLQGGPPDSLCCGRWPGQTRLVPARDVVRPDVIKPEVIRHGVIPHTPRDCR